MSLIDKENINNFEEGTDPRYDSWSFNSDTIWYKYVDTERHVDNSGLKRNEKFYDHHYIGGGGKKRKRGGRWR